MRLSLRTKLVLAIGLPLLVVYGAMLVILLGQVRARTFQRLEQNGADLAEHLAARIDHRLLAVERSVAAAGLALARSSSTEDETLYRMIEAHLGLDAVPSGFGVTLGTDTWRVVRGEGGVVERARGAEIAGPEGWTEPIEDGAGGGIVRYRLPVNREDGQRGSVWAELSVEDLRDICAHAAIGGARVGLVSPEGRWVLPPGPETPAASSLIEAAAELGAPEIPELVRHVLSGRIGVLQHEGVLLPGRRWVFFAPLTEVGWTFVGALPESVVLASSRRQAQLGIGILLAGLVLILVLLVVMSERITRPLRRLSRAVETLGTGDLDVRVHDVETRDEIGDLAGAFNRMVGDLRSHVNALQRETAAREAVESELRVGRRIQTSLLPKDFPQSDSFALHAVNLPAKHVAGDFYDWFWLDERRLVFLIADVSGKGVPAALFMAVARTVLRQVCSTHESLADALTAANGILEETNADSMYVTLFLGIHDVTDGKLRYVNAAHPLPWSVDRQGRVRSVGEVSGRMVGLLPGASYSEGETTLAPGEWLVLYTDGVPEAESPAGDSLGDEWLRGVLEQSSGKSPGAVCERVVEEIDVFQQGQPHDDVTLVILSRGG